MKREMRSISKSRNGSALRKNGTNPFDFWNSEGRNQINLWAESCSSNVAPRGAREGGGWEAGVGLSAVARWQTSSKAVQVICGVSG